MTKKPGVRKKTLNPGYLLFFTLWLVLCFGLDYRRAIAHTLVVVGLGWNGTGAIVLGAIGQVQWDWLPALLLGSLLGGYLGAALAFGLVTAGSSAGLSWLLCWWE